MRGISCLFNANRVPVEGDDGPEIYLVSHPWQFYLQ